MANGFNLPATKPWSIFKVTCIHHVPVNVMLSFWTLPCIKPKIKGCRRLSTAQESRMPTNKAVRPAVRAGALCRYKFFGLISADAVSLCSFKCWKVGSYLQTPHVIECASFTSMSESNAPSLLSVRWRSRLLYREHYSRIIYVQCFSDIDKYINLFQYVLWQFCSCVQLKTDETSNPSALTMRFIKLFTTRNCV